MRRCYRSAALVLGGILLAGNPLVNSCGLTLNVHAADAALTEDKFISLDTNDYDVLLKIVEAEAGCEDLAGKMLVANVIMNRVNSPAFPNSVTEVVYQTHKGRAQFSPTENGTIDRVSVSQETVDAVDRVMNGKDDSMGALYFRSIHSKGTWHDRALQRIIEHGNHIFYIG